MSKRVALVIMNDTSGGATPTVGGGLTFSSTGGSVTYAAATAASSYGETFNHSDPGPSSNIEIPENSALLFIVDNNRDLVIENGGDYSNSITLGANVLEIGGGKKLTIGSGATLFLGGYDAKLNNNGLAAGEPIDTTDYESGTKIAAGGPGKLTINSNLVLDNKTWIHIGRTSKNTGSDGNAYVDSLTVSGQPYTLQALV